MKRMSHVLVLLAIILAAATGCTSKPDALVEAWATTVVPDPPPHPSCVQKHKVSEPTTGTGPGLARYSDKLLSDYAALKKDYQACIASKGVKP